MYRVASLLFALLLFPLSLYSIPQFALLTGNRCSNCHVALGGGGGMRNDLGWYSFNDVSVIPRDGGLLGWMYKGDNSNKFFDGVFSWGMDLRVQNTRAFNSPDAQRVTFPMQTAVYASLKPVKALTIEGGYNLSSLRKSPSGEKVRFPGQRDGHLSLISNIDDDLPTIRVGIFRPSVGMRYDDHTMYPVNYITATSRQNYLAPNWAEYGSEITWESEKWLTTQLGLFGSSGLQQVQLSDGSRSHSLISGNSPTVTAKAVLWNRFDDDAMNGYLGGSLLLNGDFSMVSLFGGFGITDALSVMLDVTRTSKTDVQQSTNVMAEIMYQVYSPVYVYARYETGTTTQALALQSAHTNSAVLGSQIFLLPYVELRPEYRIFDTYLPGFSGRWNFQLHIFY